MNATALAIASAATGSESARSKIQSLDAARYERRSPARQSLTALNTLLYPVRVENYRRMQIGLGGHVLDVGCGHGVDTLQLGDMVGPGGEVRGIDVDPEAVEFANRRAVDAGAKWVVHQSGNANALPWKDGSFDAVQSFRTLSYVDDIGAAIGEMYRVLRPEGWACAVEIDWGSTSLGNDEAETQRLLQRVNAEIHLPSGYAARNLVRTFTQKGFEDVTAVGFPLVMTDYKLARDVFNMDAVEQIALSEEWLTNAEYTRWHAGLQRAQVEGTFVASAMVMLVSGRR